MGNLIDLYVQYFWIRVEIFVYTLPLVIVFGIIFANSELRKRKGWK